MEGNTTVRGVENVLQHTSERSMLGEMEGEKGGLVEDLNIEEDGGVKAEQG